MSIRFVGRRGGGGVRRGEAGLTLIELLVAVAIIAVGVVGITSGLAATEHLAAINQDQAQREVAMRQLSDYVRDSNPASGLQYVTCANTTTRPYSLSGAGLPPGLTPSIVAPIRESTLATRNGVATPAISTSGCAAGTGDWGVQEITLKVSDARGSLTRTVWKSMTW